MLNKIKKIIIRCTTLLELKGKVFIKKSIFSLDSLLIKLIDHTSIYILNSFTIMAIKMILSYSRYILAVEVKSLKFCTDYTSITTGSIGNSNDLTYTRLAGLLQ